ncbi:MAG TPA: hypothetical protein V6C76_03920 [Drouetiella sp.]
MQTNFRWLHSFVVSASTALLACSQNAAFADTQGSYFSVPAAPVKQGWPYTAPAQLFQPSTTSDTTNPLNVFNPASVANSGFNSNYLSSPFLPGSTPYGGGSTYSGYSSGYSSGLGSLALRAATSQIPYVGGYAGAIGLPFLGGGWGGLGGWGSSWSGIGHGIGYGGLGSWGGGWGGIGHGFGGWGHGYGGWSSGYSAFSPFNYGGYGSFGYGGMSPIGGSSFQGTVPNRIIQTGPSPASGNYYQPATADPSASGGYYASSSPASTYSAPVKTKNQPTSYYGKSGTDDMWGGGGSPLPKDLNSVPWAK